MYFDPDQFKNTHIILLNGPPNVGKDFLGTACVEYLNSKRSTKSSHSFKNVKFRDSLVADTARHYTICRDQLLDLLEDGNTKEVAHTRLHGDSPREALMKTSAMIKGLYGDDVFALYTLSKLKCNTTNICTDCGTEAEYESAIKYLGKESVVTIKLISEGCSFKGDNRVYLDKYDAVWSNDKNSEKSVSDFNEFVMDIITKKGFY